MENKTFEELLEQLSTIVQQFENSELSLDESVEKYQEAMKISIECKKRLDEAKEVITTKMTENGQVNFK